mmetsp:Transcript_95242/g.254693  ORF Transcript_95242/g.254693 Transcript_95242/m.254693 type:complete len:311 (+) Transcript_95242:630-1562(+)
MVPTHPLYLAPPTRPWSLTLAPGAHLPRSFKMSLLAASAAAAAAAAFAFLAASSSAAFSFFASSSSARSLERCDQSSLSCLPPISVDANFVIASSPIHFSAYSTYPKPLDLPSWSLTKITLLTSTFFPSAWRSEKIRLRSPSVEDQGSWPTQTAQPSSCCETIFSGFKAAMMLSSFLSSPSPFGTMTITSKRPFSSGPRAMIAFKPFHSFLDSSPLSVTKSPGWRSPGRRLGPPLCRGATGGAAPSGLSEKLEWKFVLRWRTGERLRDDDPLELSRLFFGIGAAFPFPLSDFPPLSPLPPPLKSIRSERP